MPTAARCTEPIVEVQMLRRNMSFPFILISKHLVAPCEMEDADKWTIVQSADMFLELYPVGERLIALRAHGSSARRC